MSQPLPSLQMDDYLLLLPALALASALLTWLVKREALSRGMLDHPNARSSHVLPTPRGGGLSIVIVTTFGLFLLWYWGIASASLIAAQAIGGIALAIIGFMDDRRSLSAMFRLAVHFAAATFAVCLLGGLPPLQIGSTVADLGWAGDLLAVVGIVWVLNLFNFMDGIDGIAGGEAMFLTIASATLGFAGGMSPDVPASALVLAAACAGFLVWNWPPARIFMGDVGSGYVGYLIAVLALASMHRHVAAAWVSLILGGVFFVDATVTLLRRLARGEGVYRAHRSHAYQRLARRWGSHRRVSLAVLAIDVFWLLPMACVAAISPSMAGWVAAGALFPLVVLALVAGSGKPES